MQDARAVGAAGQRVGERTADTFQDARSQQEPPDLGRLALEDLGDEVVGDGALAAGELADESLRVGRCA